MSPPADRGRTYVTRHWRGQLSLWASVLVNSVLLLPAALSVAMTALIYAAVDYGPATRVWLSYAVMAGTVALWLWEVVGVWRSGRRSRERGGLWISRWSARVLVLALGVIPVVYWHLMSVGVAQLEEMASDTDPVGKVGYTISIEGEIIVVEGAMAWSMAERFAATLDANPGVTIAALTSDGGHEQVGRRMADEVIARGLDTLVTSHCGSACTYVFASGHERMLARGALLGFHSAAPVYGDKAGLLVRLAQERMREYLVRAGIPEAFIARVEKTPPSDVWVPSVKELIDANVVTAIVD